jgi:type I restriction enzyme S subunit
MNKIPAGYKKTEVGIIPEDWVVVQLRNLISKIIDNRGKTPPYTYNDPIELIETASINFVNQSPDYSKITKFVSRLTYDNWFRDHPAKNDLLISTVGEYSGSSSLLNEDRGTIAQNLIALRIRQADAKFVFYWTRSSIFKMQLEQVMMSHAQPSLRVPWLLNFKLSIPPNIFEQATIATALNDADALITQLEKLIAKKRLIKQGAMQQLLTGKKRLAGFDRHPDGRPKGYKQTIVGPIPEDWDVSLLSNLSNKIGDGIHTTPQYNANGEYAFINGNNLLSGKIYIYEQTQKVAKEEYLIHKKDLNESTILLSINGTIGNVALYSGERVVLGKSVAYINLNDRINRLYLYYCIQSCKIISYFENELTGTTIKNLGLGSIRNTPILYPPNKAEQASISQVISDMNTEIDTLESRLSKYKQIKQGMMQTLLTGKVRLL